MSKSRSFLVFTSMLVACLVALSVQATGTRALPAPAVNPVLSTASALELRQNMRRLWEDHAVWTRQVIVSLFADLPDTPAAVARLQRNQDDIGDAIKPFYGDPAGVQLAALLHEHVNAAAETLVAAKTSDGAALSAALARLYGNGEDVAIFLAGANPGQWPLDRARSMMRMHLDLTVEEALKRLAADHAADVAAYDHVRAHILEMADMLSIGIISQFPNRFRT